MTEPSPELTLSGPAGRAAYDGCGGASGSAIAGLHGSARVATPLGPVPARDLRIGDQVLTSEGLAEVAGIAVRWLQPDSLAIDPATRPVRLLQAAIDGGRPEEDLVLAPGQMLRVDGASGRAGDLVNGATVLREPVPDMPVDYLQIDIGGLALLVEGVECPTGGGGGAAPLRLSPPLGSVGVLTGNIARADHAGVVGWAMDQSHTHVPVPLEVLVGGRAIARVLADRRRPDLEMAGLGDGSCGFDIRFSRPLPADRDHVLVIRRESDGSNVPGSPLLLRKPRASTEVLATLLRSPQDAVALAQGIEQLLQARASRALTVQR